MSLRYRPMRPKDVGRCIDIIEAHPVIGSRYRGAIPDLRKAWLHLLDFEAKVAGVMEDTEKPGAICFVGVAVFVSDDFVRGLKTPPLRWFGPELAKRIAGENSPLLSNRQLRDANSCGGLTSLTWEACFCPKSETRPEIYHRMMSTFIEEHRGYFLKEAIANQIDSVERLQWTLNAGGMLWNPEQGRYVEWSGKNLKRIVREPHIVAVTREMERSRLSSWVGAIFDYHPPKLGFSRGEQQLLVSALSGATDEELSDCLGTSPSTIKTTWRSVYNRAASRLTELFPEPSQADAPLSPRGKEKRRRLLAYLREHPEELRPVSRKLAEENARLKDVM